jgi:hypothetical protein
MKSIGRFIWAGQVLASLMAWSVGAASSSSELQAPLRVLADGKPIDVDVGHAAPLVTDFDGDGRVDLLVGQFGEGKLRIYRNSGSNHAPKFDRFAWFKAGMSDGKVPSG